MVICVTLLVLPVSTVVGAETENAALAVLEAHCTKCHNPDEKKGELDLTTRETALTGGDSGAALTAEQPAESLLWERIATEEMPPTESLPQAAREVIRAWLDAGASWERTLQAPKPAKKTEEAWYLRPLTAVEPPVKDIPEEWAGHPIDRFIYARLYQQGLEPAPLADRRTLIRRATYDLTGLPPTPEEIEAFVDDPREDEEAYEALLLRLLQSPHYGERWGRHWLDVIRFGESHGYEQNHLRDNAWPFRDYVIRTFNEDKPFDQFVLEQLAGDQIAAGDPDVEVATGFLVAGTHDTVGISNLEGQLQQRANDLDDILSTTAAAFLGLTLNCARCHDHKFDPLSQEDYYRWQSIFAGVRHGSREWAAPDAEQARHSTLRPLRERQEQVEDQLAALQEEGQERVVAQREELLERFTHPAVDPLGTEETFESVTARYVRMTIAATSGGAPVLDEFEVWTTGETPRNVALASSGATVSARATRTDDGDPEFYSAKHLIDGELGEQWISGEGGRGQFTITLAEETQIGRIYWSRDRQGAYRSSVPTEYVIEVSRDGEKWQTIADAEHRRPYTEELLEEALLEAVWTEEEHQRLADLRSAQAEVRQALRAIPPLPTAYVGNFEQPEQPTHLLVRGNPMDEGDVVAPGSLGALAGIVPEFVLDPQSPEGERRLALARWLTHDDNPLAPRVWANRVWHYHFGRGLVATPSDFGENGIPPSHPELLDWLASRVRQLGWRLKPLHLEIMRTRAYRQASTFHEENAARDADAVYLWRFRPRRLTAEEVRDTVLAVSCKLDRSQGGPGFRLYRYTVDNVATYYPIEEFGPETFRRGVYHQAARSVKPDLLGEFDCPDCSLPAPRREMTTSPLQALSMLHGKFVLGQADFVAQRIAEEIPHDIPAQVRRAYVLALGRPAEDHETQAAAQLVQQHGLSALCRALFNLHEFVYVR